MNKNGWARSSAVEHLPFKQRVGGSRPPALTECKIRKTPTLFGVFNFKYHFEGNMHFVYILKSLKSGRHYIGETKDLSERLQRHNNNRNKYTKGKGPWEIVVYCRVENKSQAVKLERKLKSLKNSLKAIDYVKSHCEKIEHSDF